MTLETWTQLPPKEKRRTLWEGMTERRGCRGKAFVRLLPELLEGLHWNGGISALVDIVPGPDEPCDVEEIERSMQRLGYQTRFLESDPGRLPMAEFPLLLVTRDGLELVRSAESVPPADELAKGRWTVGSVVLKPGEWRLLAFERREGGTALEEDYAAALEFPRRGLLVALGLAFVINLLALSTSFYTMIVYDRVIGGQSLLTLGTASLGVGLSLVFLLVFRWYRASYLAWTGKEFSRRLADWTLEKLCAIPMGSLARLPVASQVHRVRDLERLRDLIAGPLAIALTDLPFVVLALGAIAFLGGWIVLAPLVALVVQAALGYFFSKYLASAIRGASVASSRRQEMLLDACQSVAQLRMTGDISGWKRRFEQVALTSAEALRDHSVRMGLVQSVAQGSSGLTALVTLAFGVGLVISGQLTPGGLIATMLLIWRVLAAPQMAMVSWSRLGQLAISWRQMQALARARSEVIDPSVVQPLEELVPSIEFSRVTVRFDAENDAALSGVSFSIEPGELAVVLGRNGAGKSTLLKTITGLYAPVGGSVLVAGRDIRQFEPRDLRVWMSYLPEMPDNLNGTVRENLLLGSPLRSDEECLEVLQKIAGRQFAQYFPEGLETRVSATPLYILGTAARCLSLARAVLRRSKILLLDDPLLTHTTKPALLEILAARKGRDTTVLVTEDADLIKIADRAIVLDRGSVVHVGPILPTPQ